jgi:parvulin-like peptidyl-prolyl isomerase
MKKVFLGLFFLIFFNSFVQASTILATVNGVNITTDVAPKNFNSLDKDRQKLIIHRLVQKRLASDYALSSDVVKTKEFKKVLEHVFKMSEKSVKNSDSLANLLKKDATLKGYTKEQLYSKKGLLAFDFILNQKAEEFSKNENAIKNYYEQNRYKYDTPAMIELLSIVVDDKKTADEVLGKLNTSKDKFVEFSKLAKEYSKAPSKNDGGYFGKIPFENLNEVLKPILKGLKRGEYTKPVKTEFGYQIFYVLNVIPEFKSDFESVKSQVKDDYLQLKVKQWAMKKIDELEKNAKIEIKF